MTTPSEQEARLAEIRARAEAATAGPWRWEVNLDGKQVNLQGGVRRYDISVIRFERWGMNGAAPTFLSAGQSEMTQICERADHFVTPAPGREHHASWFQLLDHRDASFIEHARADIPFLLDLLASREVEADAPKCLECGEPVEEIIERSWWQHIDPKGRMLHNVVAPDRTCRDERCHIVNPHHHAPVEADARLAELERELVMVARTQSPIRLGPTSAALAAALTKQDGRITTLEAAISHAASMLENFAGHIDDVGGTGGDALRAEAVALRAMQSAPIAAPADGGEA